MLLANMTQGIKIRWISRHQIGTRSHQATNKVHTPCSRATAQRCSKSAGEKASTRPTVATVPTSWASRKNNSGRPLQRADSFQRARNQVTVKRMTLKKQPRLLPWTQIPPCTEAYCFLSENYQSDPLVPVVAIDKTESHNVATR